MTTRVILLLSRNIFCNIRVLLCISVALLLVYMLKMHSSEPTRRNVYHDLNQPPSGTSGEPDMKCLHPKLDPFHPSLIKFFKQLPALKCDEEDNWVYVVNGTFHITKSISDKYGDISCDIYPMVRDGDFKTGKGSVIKDIKNGTSLTSDFFTAECKSGKSGKVYSNLPHCGIAYKKEVHERPDNLPETALGLNVMMVGYDSVSRMTGIRKFVKARDYFLNVLKGFELADYNILGDGTPAALLPILTAQTEEELPEVRRGHRGAQPVDGHPWIWDKFKAAGYVTAYSEDIGSSGTFQYRMMGFKNQPTDHYQRNFFIGADPTQKKPFCYGSKPKHQYFLDWLRDIYVMYTQQRKFVFGFHGEMSHADSNKIDYLDEDVRDFFQYMNTHGYLNNTVLIFMSDHGARFTQNREAVQGKQEERMPMFGFRFPPWFETKYPDVMKTLKINAHRLTTPFDIYETLNDLLNFSGTGQGDITKRGISLFKEIPKERTCQHASIEAHWCACLDWKPVDLSDQKLKRVLQTIIDSLNNLTSPHRTHCAVLGVKEITKALIATTNSKVLAFKKAADVDGRVGDFSAKTKDSEIVYQVTLITEPGNGHFDTTVRHIVASDEMVLSNKDISRTNAYGSAPDCIAENFPYLRQFCYCKK